MFIFIHFRSFDRNILKETENSNNGDNLVRVFDEAMCFSKGGGRSPPNSRLPTINNQPKFQSFDGYNRHHRQKMTNSDLLVSEQYKFATYSSENLFLNAAANRNNNENSPPLRSREYWRTIDDNQLPSRNSDAHVREAFKNHSSPRKLLYTAVSSDGNGSIDKNNRLQKAAAKQSAEVNVGEQQTSPLRFSDISDRICINPFNTDRLKETRQRGKNVVLSILKNGDVAVEFVKTKSRTKEELVVEVCRITKDGLRVRRNY